MGLRNKWVILALTAFVLLASGGCYMIYKEKYGGGIITETREAQVLEKVESVKEPKDSYDVIVVGTDPEGVAGAVSAARNGLKTLLVDGRNRNVLGGLMTEGWLNSLDNNYDKDKPHLGLKDEVLNKGIFQEFYDKIEGTSFDVTTAANVFYGLVKQEKNIDLLMKAKAIAPILAKGKEEDAKRVDGLTVTLENGTKKTIMAKAVIDATQDADIGAAAGAPFSIGREDLGDPDSKMAVTIVFRLKNADEAFWKEVRKRLDNDGNDDTGSDEYSAYGYGETAKYQPLNPKQVKMRGLNIGRQNDGTILINALQLFNVDPVDPKSVQEAYALADQELPRILEFIKEKYPEFGKLELDGTAPELYVRESRHMYSLYRLTILDVLENRDQWDRVAFGSYRVDLQRTSPQDNGAEILAPYKYAIPFRSLVPKNMENLLVVGRSAGYDSLPHGSARVIPTGMAEAQSAGAAVKIATDHSVTFLELARSKDLIAGMQQLVNSQRMELKPYTKKQPYQEHKAYPGLKAAVYLGIAVGGGDNDFKLDEPSNPQRMVNNLNTAKRKYKAQIKGDPAAALKPLADAKKDASKEALTLAQAAYTAAKAAGLNTTLEQAEKDLIAKRLLKPETVQQITDKQKLTNGDAYMILKDFLEVLVNIRF